MRILRKEIESTTVHLLFIVTLSLLLSSYCSKMDLTSSASIVRIIVLSVALVSINIVISKKWWFISLITFGLGMLFPELVVGLTVPVGLLTLSVYPYSNKPIARFLEETGLVNRDSFEDVVVKTMVWFTVVVIILLIVGLITFSLDRNDTKNVVKKINSLPVTVLVTGIFVSPIVEELFFRGVLYPRVGMVLSSILFSIAHASYGSVGELIKTFVIGMIFCKIRSRERSLVIPILIHFLINLLSILMIKSLW